eukprot:GILK01006599.1.p1 GENE.GILK01006599.1~~GILK01006599.1.p1  ORF type:complete len:437 (+),score=53.83 GILK01006599.1:54-1313(+)
MTKLAGKGVNYVFWRTLTFLFYASQNCAGPFLIILFRKYHLTTGDIGFINAIAPLAGIVAAPAWAWLADQTKRHKLIFGLLSIISCIFFLCLYFANSLRKFVVFIFLASFFNAPLSAFLDGYILQALGTEKAEYGQIRLWGSFAWGITPVAIGKIIDNTSLDAIFVSTTAVTALSLVLFYFLPSTLQTKTHDDDVAVRPARRSQFKQWGYFMFVVSILGIGWAIIGSFLFLFLLDDLGASNTLLGLSIAFSITTEIPSFFFSKQLLTRVGVRGMILLAHAIFTVRLIGYSVMKSAWMVLPIQMLHGVSFSLFWTAAVTHTNALSPPGMESTSLGLLNGVFGGVAPTIGAILGGYLYTFYGARIMFACAAGAVACSGIFFLLTYSSPTTESGTVAETASLLANHKEIEVAKEFSHNSKLA